MGRLPSFPAHLAAVRPRPPPNHNLAHGHDILSFPAASRSLALIIPGVAFLPSGNERDANDAMRLLFLCRFMEASVQIQPQICVSIHRSAEGQANHRLADAHGVRHIKKEFLHTTSSFLADLGETYV